MDEEISITVSLPLDSSGFVRRECPTCGRQFKWFNHDEDEGDAEEVDQYFCPLCGVPAGVDSWWTQEQLDHIEGLTGPLVNRMLGDAFQGIGGLSVDAGEDQDGASPELLVEPDDMIIVQSPCHPNEPLKVPEQDAGTVRCLVCGAPFAS